MISREILEQLKLPALKEVCRGYNLAISGKKTELFERIIAHQEKLEKQLAEQQQRLAYGAEAATLADGTPDIEFEATMTKFFDWSNATFWNICKLSESGVSFQKVDRREIRAAFKDYDPAASSLRADRLVPVPHTKMEIFLEMFFDKLGGEWEMFCECSDERGEEDFDESEQRKFVQEMKRSTETTVSQWCATGYANNRD
tara:strand:+ start:3689 stop:4288 length:600 start_codon:yes stop_codon:yes gene_type:complete